MPSACLPALTAQVLPPPGPSSGDGADSSISPMAILPTMTAAPIASAGRFSPLLRWQQEQIANAYRDRAHAVSDFAAAGRHSIASAGRYQHVACGSSAGTHAGHRRQPMRRAGQACRRAANKISGYQQSYQRPADAIAIIGTQLPSAFQIIFSFWISMRVHKSDMIGVFTSGCLTKGIPVTQSA
jgi:hypothetical protein